MNNLLFYALLTALLYYFFIYLPQQKKNINNSLPPKLTQSQFTQTEPDPITITENYEPRMIKFPSAESIPDPEVIKNLQKDIAQKERTITGLNQSYNKLETKTKQELDKLKQQLTEKDNKVKELSEVEKNLDTLLKKIQDLNIEIEK